MDFKRWRETLQKKHEQYKLEIRSVLVLIMGILAVSFFSFPDVLENYTLDLRFRSRKPLDQHTDTVIIEISKDTLEKLKTNFPIPRRHYGSVINALKVHQAKLVAFDIVFIEPSISSMNFKDFCINLEKAGKKYDEEKLKQIYESLFKSGRLSHYDDKAFRAHMTLAGNVFLPYHLIFKELKKDSQGFFVADGAEDIYSSFKEVIKGTGFINLVDIGGGKVRKVPLLIKHEGKIKRHIILNMVLEALGLDEKDLKISKGVIKVANKLNIPVDENYQMTVNWAGKWVETFQHYSFVDVETSYGRLLKGEEPEIDLNIFKGKICIIGMTETGIGDAKSNPIDDIFPGVGTWLHALNTILTRSFVAQYPTGLTFLYSLAFMLAAILIVKKLQPQLSIPLVIVITFIYIGFTFFIFAKFNIWLNITRPTLLIVLGVVITQSYNYLKLKDLVDLQLTFEQKLVMTAKTGVPIEKQKIGRYQVMGEIGRGGMAIVFKGKEKDTGKIVAIKVISPRFSSDPVFKIRFKREAKVMMRIRHPNIIEIYELNKQMGVYYYAMEYFIGKDLKDKFPSIRKKGEKEIIDILRQILDGLRSVHEKDIVHRDIKPANILINDENLIKITDFGLARPIEDDNLMTTVGQALGTPAYCAPEQIMGKKVSARSDIYSLGVVAYEMVEGQLPFRASTIADLARLKVYGKLTPFPKDNPFSKGLHEIIYKMLIANPAERYQSAGEVLVDIEKLENNKSEKNDISEAGTEVWETKSPEE